MEDSELVITGYKCLWRRIGHAFLLARCGANGNSSYNLATIRVTTNNIVLELRIWDWRVHNWKLIASPPKNLFASMLWAEDMSEKINMLKFSRAKSGYEWDVEGYDGK